MNKISVFILTKNEEIHIERSINSAKKITDQIYVIDSDSTDATCNIAKSMGVFVYNYDWDSESTWSKKFNWAIDTIPIKTDWILRLDSDEYLTDNFIDYVHTKLAIVSSEVAAIQVNRRLFFLRKWMKHGGDYPIPMTRIFRKGAGKYENRLLDEHMEINKGKVIYANIDLVDDKICTLTQWINTHNSYSIKEALQLINQEIGLFADKKDFNNSIDKSSLLKRKKKNWYSKLPRYWRPWAFFIYKYFFRLGFLDGREGYLWCILQCFWYRTLCDAKMDEIYTLCGKDREKIVEYIEVNYKIKI